MKVKFLNKFKKENGVANDPVKEMAIQKERERELRRKARIAAKPKLTLKQILKQRFRENILLLLTITFVIGGVVLGFILRAKTNLSHEAQLYFSIPGELFLRVLKFLILPLVSSSLICGISGLGSANLGKIARRSILFYIASMASAVIIGLVLSATIRPGLINRAPTDQDQVVEIPIDRKISTIDTIFDLLRNLFPDNMVHMCFNLYETTTTPHYKSYYKYNTTMLELANLTIETIPKNETKLYRYIVREQDYLEKGARYRFGLNVLGLVVFCIAFGVVLGQMNNENSRVLLMFFEAVNDASIRIIRLVMWATPLGVGSLVCYEVIHMDNPEEKFKSISYYLLTVLVGLAIQGIIILPGMYMIICRKSILPFLKDMSEALLIALATSSSAATLPITFRCIEVKHRIPKLISRFVLPVGAIVNLDGTALYEAAAAIFIAQISNVELRFVDYVLTSVTATLAAIGASGIPSAGLVTMIIVLSALNIPQEQISLIYTVDWFLDRCRTMINVWGDSVATAVVAHLSRHEVQPDDSDEEYEEFDASKPHRIENVSQKPHEKPKMIKAPEPDHKDTDSMTHF